MMTTQEKSFYEKHLLLTEIGEKGQEKLKKASVLVVGCGGLGCPVLTYLNAAGIGRIGIIDPDIVSESNLHRQILFSFDDIGKLKVHVAKEKLNRQNPYNTIECFPYSLDLTNAEKLISKYDFVIDGSDNFSTRYLANDVCVVLNKTLISGSIERFEGQISVFNYHEGATYRCLYPEPSDEYMPDCSVAGVIGVIPGIIGILMATEAIKIIIGIGKILSGKLLIYNSLNMSFKTFYFEPDIKNQITKLALSYSNTSCIIKEIEHSEFRNWVREEKDFQLIDVRESFEHEKFNIGGENIPLGVIDENIARFATDKPIVLYCQSGVRCKKAIQLLKENGFNDLYNLKNGLNAT